MTAPEPPPSAGDPLSRREGDVRAAALAEVADALQAALLLARACGRRLEDLAADAHQLEAALERAARALRHLAPPVR